MLKDLLNIKDSMGTAASFFGHVQWMKQEAELFIRKCQTWSRRRDVWFNSGQIFRLPQMMDRISGSETVGFRNGWTMEQNKIICGSIKNKRTCEAILLSIRSIRYHYCTLRFVHATKRGYTVSHMLIERTGIVCKDRKHSRMKYGENYF